MYDLFLRIPAKKRDRITAVALSEFASCGYREAKVNTIASKAGISIGILYKYFESKQDLYMYIVEHTIDRLDAMLDDLVKEGDDVLAVIEKQFCAIQKYGRESCDVIRLYTEICRLGDENIARVVAARMEGRRHSLYSSIIGDAQKKGFLPADIDPGLFSFFIANMLIVAQFSYGDVYHRERMKLFVGEDAFDRDKEVLTQFMLFASRAFGIAPAHSLQTQP